VEKEKEKVDTSAALKDRDLLWYQQMLRMAVADGILSGEESTVLDKCRTDFDMSDHDHYESLKAVGLTAIEFEQMKMRSMAPAFEDDEADAVGEKGVKAAECVVCLDNAADHLLMHCMHVCLCEPCSEMLEETSKVCPKCRASYDKIARVYF